MLYKTAGTRQMIAIALAILIGLPVATYANNGKRYFKEGIQYAQNKQWDRAAERLALAVAEVPSNVEYQLQLQRALVNAAIMGVEHGDRLAAQKDYNAAYNAYRQAYAFDATNEIALVKMRRMLEAQGIPTDGLPVAGDPTDKPARVAVVTAKGGLKSGSGPASAPKNSPPVRRPVRTDVVFHGTNLLVVIEQIAQTIHLNVAFDQQIEVAMKNRIINIELRDVTAGEALEIVLQTNNLMYWQVSRRTIVITFDSPQNRTRFEPMVVRTFYIKNADINELKSMIAATVGSKQIVSSKQLNALVVRDSKANLELIDAMIASLDKSKAEVLIDVSLYEVSQNDLLQLGNQFRAIGDASSALSLSQLGGIDQQKSLLGTAARTLKGPFGLALGLPTSTLSFFQDKGKAKLLASTQVHVLDNEQHQVRIGQRVPIKTGSSPILALGTTSTGSTNSTGNANGLGTIDNIQYENVGLNIDLQPQVFEDEVQVKMKIESSSVDRSTGDLTPSFNQRTMSSVARIKDGQTTMIAGVSRIEDSKQVKGVPFIGLIPILGRFFSTPTTSNQQSDVVITVTPHILRRADIRDADHLARDAGRGADASQQLTIQEILNLADDEEARQNPVAFDTPPEKNGRSKAGQTVTTAPLLPITPMPEPSGIVKTADVSTRPSVTPHVERTPVDKPGQPIQGADGDDDDDDDDDDDATKRAGEPVVVTARAASAVAIKGQDFYVAISLAGNAVITSAIIALDYDANVFDVKQVRDSGLLHAEPRFTAQDGKLTISLEQPAGAKGVAARGQLLLIVFSTKRQGQSPLTLNGLTSLRSPSGQMVPVKLQSAIVVAK